MTISRITSASIALALSAGIYSHHASAQDSLGIDFYGSLRTQLESVRPDKREQTGAYTSLRDAYSRLGVKFDYPLNATLALDGQLELPFDSVNLRLRDPYDQRENIRIARIGLRGGFGSLSYGQQWMPYYNAVAAPVDMFSTYYSGFATYTVFRVARTLAYASPDLNGFSVGAAYAGSRANLSSTSRIDARRWQAVASYTLGDTRIAAGIDDRGDAGCGRNRIYGFSASHKIDKLYLALKYEIFDTKNRHPGSFSSDGNRAINLFGSYVLGKSTFKLMLARLDNYGGNIVHAGIDYALSDRHTLFAELYREADTAALTARRGGLADIDARMAGGRALAVGLRYDF
ncbi:porin [Massilia sp. Mn16-1_5]|uniref:porin n=1 Tax=Massilia sp. Mn16-1_5 TaxID=2079199 RepID=UPI00109E5B65|nr:porin [Massilia sp. Mn16-1_5]THC44516.1 porin [Massilia sp. Mn16-1_5]